MDFGSNRTCPVRYIFFSFLQCVHITNFILTFQDLSICCIVLRCLQYVLQPTLQFPTVLISTFSSTCVEVLQKHSFTRLAKKNTKTRDIIFAIRTSRCLNAQPDHRFTKFIRECYDTVRMLAFLTLFAIISNLYIFLSFQRLAHSVLYWLAKKTNEIRRDRIRVLK